ncbi:MAG TPA: hypothetical protein VLQ79_08055 [Myxococcaceae bacterium]|nr:hypothetical protein [Myxococcaceae bacterium]
MQLAPWDYLFVKFNESNFPDLYLPLLVASFLGLIAIVVFYNVRTRQLHRHQVYLQMYEWMLWTLVITFSLMLVYVVFAFDMIIVLGTLVIGLGMLVWTRFVRFPPYFAAYERQLAKQRYYSRTRYAHPETTIRSKSSRRRRRR